MAFAKKANDSIWKGRRSRGPSPIQSLPSLSSDEESGEKIRVGEEYQAVIPPFIPPNERRQEPGNDRAILLWKSTEDLSDDKLDKFISVAKEKYGYNDEQALGMLLWYNYDPQSALNILPNFSPSPDEWTVEDEVIFEQAFQFHGKNFRRIHQMLPHISFASILKHYYSWKKPRC